MLKYEPFWNTIGQQRSDISPKAQEIWLKATDFILSSGDPTRIKSFFNQYKLHFKLIPSIRKETTRFNEILNLGYELLNKIPSGSTQKSAKEILLFRCQALKELPSPSKEKTLSAAKEKLNSDFLANINLWGYKGLIHVDECLQNCLELNLYTFQEVKNIYETCIHILLKKGGISNLISILLLDRIYQKRHNQSFKTEVENAKLELKKQTPQFEELNDLKDIKSVYQFLSLIHI